MPSSSATSKADGSRLNLTVRSKMELEDIHSSGIIGLIRALEDFDISKNVLFKTYATWRVRGHVLDYLRKIDFVSRGDRAKLRNIEQKTQDLSLRFSREPSAFEVADELGMDLRECHRLLEMAQLNFLVSLDQVHETKEFLKTGDPKLRDQAIVKFMPIVKYVMGSNSG